MADDIADFNPNVGDNEAIAEGEAAERLIRGAGSILDKLKAARGLQVGQRLAKEAEAAGRRYSKVFGDWLAQHPWLEKFSGPDRAAALWCLEPGNWPDALKMIQRLDDKHRQSLGLRGLKSAVLEARGEAKPRATTAKPEPANVEPTKRERASNATPAAHDATIAAAVEKATAALKQAHAAEIEVLKDTHGVEIAELKDVHLRELEAEFRRGEAQGARARAHFNAKEVRTKLPVFTRSEINLLRKALHPDGKPQEFVTMFTQASALFNDRVELLVKAVERHRRKMH
jgi:hypothetical protein